MIFYDLLKVLLLSAVPLIEQRGSIPMGVLYLDLNPWLVFIIAYLGSLLPVPFILLLFNKIYTWLQKYPFFAKIVKLIDKKINKNVPKFEKYKELALITFVAIPLPTTGLWTGSAVSAFLKLDFKKSLICTALGGLISAIIITLLSVYVPTLFH